MSQLTLVARVTELLEEIKKTHKYSMSRIYGLSNEVFNLNETPQSCASCLIRKAEQLRAWLKEENLKQAEQTVEIPTEIKEEEEDVVEKTSTKKTKDRTKNNK